MKTYTRNELSRMSSEDLGNLQRSLARYCGTSHERKARLLNNAILDEKTRRGNRSTD